VSIFKDGVVRAVELPKAVTLAVFFSGTSARTSALLERVRVLAVRDPALYVERMSALTAAAVAAADAIERCDGPRFVSSVAAHLGGLAALGEAADAPIVLPAFRELGTRAQADGAAFIPSGAGGGDVGVFVGMGDPSPSFLREAERLSLRPIPLRIDTQGVRIERP
jgi:phosphomevalonate kinase